MAAPAPEPPTSAPQVEPMAAPTSTQPIQASVETPMQAQVPKEEAAAPMIAPTATSSAGTGREQSSSAVGIKRKARKWSDDLSDFLSAVDDYLPTVPTEVIKHYMQTAGVNVVDDRVVSIVALACDKFLVDTIHECKQMGKIRNSKARKSRKVPHPQLSSYLSILP